MKTFVPSILDASVRGWVADVLGEPVVYADQRDAPRPVEAYASVMALSERTNGSPDRYAATQVGDDTVTTATLEQRWTATYTVSIYGDGHSDRARTLVNSHWDLDVAEANDARCLVVVGAIGGPTRVGIASGGVADARTLVDFELRTTTTTATEDRPTLAEATYTFNEEPL